MDISSGRTILPQEKRGRNGQPMTQILAVTCMRDEGPYAAEWIGHLLAVGVDHVLTMDLHADHSERVVVDATATLQGQGAVSLERQGQGDRKSVV